MPVPLWITLAIGGAVLARLLPHPPNVTPIMALSLVCGMIVRPRLIAAAIPFSALAISDSVLGTYDPRIMAAVYAGLLMPVLAGTFLRHRMWIPRLMGCSILGSSLFFAISNLAVFAFSETYPVNFNGLVACFNAALPFYRNTLAGDLLWCTVFAASLKLTGWSHPVRQPVCRSGLHWQ